MFYRFVNLRGSCFAEGLPEEKQPPEGFCGGRKLGCSTGNNRVVSRQRKFLPMFYRLAPLWGKIGLFGEEQYTITALCVGKYPDLSKLGCSAGNNRVVSRQRFCQ